MPTYLNGDTIRLFLLLCEADGDPVAGSSPTVSVYNPTTSKFLDWNDMRFKSAGWTTRQLVMTEISASNAPGEYTAVISDLTDFVAGTYMVEYSSTYGTENDDLVILDYTAANIAAIVSKTAVIPATPAAVGSEMVLTAAYDAAKTAASQSSVDTIDGIVDTILTRTDVATSTRLATASYSTPPTAAAIADAVWEEDTTTHTEPPSAGYFLGLGAYSAGELRADWSNGGRLDLLLDAVKAKTDLIPASPAAVGSAMTLTAAYDAAKSAASQSSVDVIDGIVDTIVSRVDVATSTRLATASYTTPPTTTAIADAVWDELLTGHTTENSAGADLSSAYSLSIYLAQEWADGGRLDLLLDAVKAKTDNLPANPAAVGSAMTLSAAYDAAKTAASQSSVDVIDGIVDTIVSRTDVATSTRLAATAYTAPTTPPTVEAIRIEMDANSTKLALLDVAISTRLAGASYTAPDNASIATILERVDVATSTRMAATAYVIPPTVEEIDTELTTNHGSGAWTGSGGATPEEIWEYATRSLTDKAGFTLDAVYDAAKTALTVGAYTAPDNASIATILSRVDVATSTRLAATAYTTPPTAVAIDLQLSGTHGAGSWAGGGATAEEVRIEIDDHSTKLSSIQGSVQTGIPNLINALHDITAADVDALLTANHGSGAWTTSGATPITAADVWAYANRALTDKSNFMLTGDYDPAKTCAQASTALSNLTWTATHAGRLDAAISTRLAAADYTAPANAKIATIEAAVLALPTLATIEGSTILAKAAAMALIAADVTSILGDTGTDIPATLTTIDGVVDAIKAKTDNLPAAPAAVSDIPTASIAAIKAKTDNLPATPAATGDAMTLTTAYDAAKVAASQLSVDALPTLADIEASTVIAHESSMASLAASVDTLMAMSGMYFTETDFTYDPDSGLLLSTKRTYYRSAADMSGHVNGITIELTATYVMTNLASWSGQRE